MAANKALSVFVSSTSRDLIEYREAVMSACRELGLGVVCMEDFEAMGIDAVAGSLAKLDIAAVYVAIVARRYGHVEPGAGKSITELEFEHAKSIGLECLCFLLDPSYPWPGGQTESSQEHRLEFFKERLKQERIVRWFKSPDDLLHQAYRALAGWMDRAGLEPHGPRQLPSPPVDFVGREEDLGLLAEDMKSGVTISGVHGQGGVGKTALALKLSERLAIHHPDGQIFFDLQGYTRPRSWQRAMTHVIRAFMPERQLPADDEALAGLYRTVLTGKRVLLLMDNARGTDQVQPLVPPVGCTLIVTSRRRFLVEGLAPHHLDTLSPDDAIRLLQTITRRLTRSAASQIARQCGYLPLALRLAGAALAIRNDLDPDRYLQKLKDTRLQTLGEVSRSIRLSEEMLPEQVRVRWRELSTLVGDFELGWAASIWGAEEDAADAYIGTLVEHSLLDWDDEKKMYRFHDLIHEYAKTKMGRLSRRNAEHRHAAFFLGLSRSISDSYLEGGATAEDSIRQFDKSWEDIYAAFSHTRTRKMLSDDTARLCCSGFPGWPTIFDVRLRPRSLIEVLQFTVELAQRLGDRSAEAYAYGGIGRAYLSLGLGEEAKKYHAQHLLITREIGDRRGEVFALANIGGASFYLGSIEEATDLASRALEIAREIDDKREQSTLSGNIGVFHLVLGKVDEALDYFNHYLDLAKSIDDRRGEGLALCNLGNALCEKGEIRKGTRLLKESHLIAEEIGDRFGELRSLFGLGRAHTYLSDSHSALEHYDKALIIVRELGDRRDEARILCDIAANHVTRGQIQSAIEFYDQSLLISRAIGDQFTTAYTQWGLGLAYEQASLYPAALECLQAHVDFLKRIQHADAPQRARYVEQLSQRIDV